MVPKGMLTFQSESMHCSAEAAEMGMETQERREDVKDMV